MERYKKFYKATYEGKKKKNLRIDRFSLDEVVREILQYIPKNDDGIIEIYEIDFQTNEKRFFKRIVVANELFLSKDESMPVTI